MAETTLTPEETQQRELELTLASLAETTVERDELRSQLDDVTRHAEKQARTIAELQGEITDRENRINALAVAVTELAHPETAGTHDVTLAVDLSDAAAIVIRIA